MDPKQIARAISYIDSDQAGLNLLTAIFPNSKKIRRINQELEMKKEVLRKLIARFLIQNIKKGITISETAESIAREILSEELPGDQKKGLEIYLRKQRSEKWKRIISEIGNKLAH